MNPIFIHNNNIPKVSDSTCSIKFTTIENALDKIKETDFDTIFIKDNLSSSYLELKGLILAYHIRLTQELEDKRLVPIVILSDVDSHILNKFDPIARILFTKNVFIIKNTIEAVKEFQTKKLKPLTPDEYQKDFLDLIEVKPPENSSSHSIANEWAIERWANLLGIEDNKTIKRNREKISSLLYFKYLKQKYILNTAKISIKENENIEGKLLLIDDKGINGWNTIVETYLKKHSRVEFKALETKYDDIDSIKKSVQVSIKSYDPNIILLDLRLLKTEMNDISGIQILKYIKEIDPSIQVIMFTASSDSLILDTLFSEGIFGYVKKDAPSEKSNNNGFEKLNILINKATDKKYLKDIYQIQKDILDTDIIKNNILNIEKKEETTALTEEEKEIQVLTLAIETIFNILNSNIPNEINFAMLSICTCLEDISSLYIFEDRSFSFPNNACWIKDNSKITNEGKNSLKNKILIIMVKKLSLTNISIKDYLTNIIQKRNDYIHSGQNQEIKNQEIIKWFEMLRRIIERIKFT